MRFIDKNWGNKYRESLQLERLVTKFLWFPVTIGSETRWLETATIRQHRVTESYDGSFYWTDEDFVDKKEEKK
jgi:hypothetical protein